MDLRDRVALRIFEAACNPMAWRFADHRIHYLPLADAAIEAAIEELRRPYTPTGELPL